MISFPPYERFPFNPEKAPFARHYCLVRGPSFALVVAGVEGEGFALGEGDAEE